jgi:ribosomal-protein-alanine N-acetyltransferase
MFFPEIVLSNLTLKNIFPDQVSDEYVSWLRSPKINRFLEVRHQEISLSSQKNFIEAINSSSDSSLFGIFLEHSQLVGTIKIGPINSIHRTSGIGILVGSLEHHGKGIATNAITGVCNAFSQSLLVRKVNAGVLSSNIASCRAFEKSGFVREGLRIQQYIGLNGKLEDEILMGKLL